MRTATYSSRHATEKRWEGKAPTGATVSLDFATSHVDCRRVVIKRAETVQWSGSAEDGPNGEALAIVSGSRFSQLLTSVDGA